MAAGGAENFRCFFCLRIKRMDVILNLKTFELYYFELNNEIHARLN